MLHADELPIDVPLVRRLVESSLPSYAGLPVAPVPVTGSTNALFRLGSELLVRMPRQRGGSATVLKEARWAPLLAQELPVAVPTVVALGEPGFGYPETWAVTTWIAGAPPSPGTPSVSLGRELARIVEALRSVPVPAAAYSDPALSWYRGGRLADLQSDFATSLAACREIDGLGLDLDRAGAVWSAALLAERDLSGREATWVHGDLLAENLLVSCGALVGVLDFGGLCVGDSAVDLVGAWEVLDAPGRAGFRQALGIADAEWAVGRGWALLIALITFPYYWGTLPERCAARQVMAAAVLADL